MSSLVAGLESLGVRAVFGLPGSQNLQFFEDLRGSRIRTVLATSETAASFMAVGYARASGEPGVLTTIPGPGLAYALPGLAEAALDSVPLLHIVVYEPPIPNKRFRHQEIPNEDMVRPLVKEIVRVDAPGEVDRALYRAYRTATSGEPGPVVLWVSQEALAPESVRDRTHRRAGESSPEPAPSDGTSLPFGLKDSIAKISKVISGARRPVIMFGLGAVGAAEEAGALVECLGAPFFTTASARGIIPEDHPLCLAFDFERGGLDPLNEVVDSSDLILALGCKLGHNGTGGFRLRLPQDRLIHVNSDLAALGGNYPARYAINHPVEGFLLRTLDSLSAGAGLGEWRVEEVAQWRSRMAEANPGSSPEPVAAGVPSGSVREVLGNLREVLPRGGILVTDSGLHQALVRRHFPVLSPRGLILPTDFQSMGFGLPAAIGSSLAAPLRKVVAVIGDGGLAMSGMELLTLAREKIPVKVMVFNDGMLNLIRLQQERDYGRSHGVRLRNPDMEALADAVGIAYFRLDEEVRSRLESAMDLPGPALMEVRLGDSREIRYTRRAARVKAIIRNTLGRRLVTNVKKLVRWGVGAL